VPAGIILNYPLSPLPLQVVFGAGPSARSTAPRLADLAVRFLHFPPIGALGKQPRRRDAWWDASPSRTEDLFFPFSNNDNPKAANRTVGRVSTPSPRRIAWESGGLMKPALRNDVWAATRGIFLSFFSPSLLFCLRSAMTFVYISRCGTTTAAPAHWLPAPLLSLFFLCITRAYLALTTTAKEGQAFNAARTFPFFDRRKNSLGV